MYGNFILSKYSGIGNAQLDMNVPKELPFANGEVIFSYGDERCTYPSIDVFIINDCYIRTEPMYNECSISVTNEKYENRRILKLVFKEDGDAISVKIYTNGIWTETHTSGINTYTSGDELFISAKEGTITITPNIGCGDDTKVYIILEKKTE